MRAEHDAPPASLAPGTIDWPGIKEVFLGQPDEKVPLFLAAPRRE